MKRFATVAIVTLACAILIGAQNPPPPAPGPDWQQGGTITGNLNVTGATTSGSFSGPTSGVTNGVAAAAGQVGQYIQNSFGPVTLAYNVTTVVGSFSLPAGDWDVWGWGEVDITGAPGLRDCSMGVSSSSNSLETGLYWSANTGSDMGQQSHAIPALRYSSASATPVYLIAGGADFNTTAGGSVTAWGYIMARRVR